MITADVKIKATVDTGDAQQKLGSIGDKLKSASAPSSGTSAINSAAASSSGGAAAAAGTSFGKLFAAAAAGYLAKQSLTMASAYYSSQEGGAASARRVNSIGGGAIGGAAAGTMLGGPLGAVIGAVAGGMLGGWQTFMQEQADILKGRRDTEAYYREINTTQGAGQSDRAFQKSLAGLSFADQLQKVSARSDAIRYGEGSDSIRELTREKTRLERALKTDTNEYRIVTERLGIQKGRYQNLLRQEEDLRFSPVLGKMLEGRDVADSGTRVGMGIGPQINVENIQSQQLTELQRIGSSLEMLYKANVDSITQKGF